MHIITTHAGTGSEITADWICPVFVQTAHGGDWQSIWGIQYRSEESRYRRNCPKAVSYKICHAHAPLNYSFVFKQDKWLALVIQTWKFHWLWLFQYLWAVWILFSNELSMKIFLKPRGQDQTASAQVFTVCNSGCIFKLHFLFSIKMDQSISSEYNSIHIMHKVINDTIQIL